MPQAGDEAPFQLLLDTITTYLFHYYLFVHGLSFGLHRSFVSYTRKFCNLFDCMTCWVALEGRRQGILCRQLFRSIVCIINPQPYQPWSLEWDTSASTLLLRYCNMQTTMLGKRLRWSNVRAERVN